MARKRKGRPLHGWLIVDKPKGVTSTAVVNKARWAFQAQKAGHAGTLDPLATGVLAVAFGEATKTVPFAQEGLKTYRFTVRLGQRTSTDDAESEVIATIGSKEGLAHLAFATLAQGDTVLVPNPAYPIHPYGVVLAGADVRHVKMTPDVDFFEELKSAIVESWPLPKMLVINYPGNPTTHCVELEFFERVIEIAKEHNIWVVHDIAYADIVFDGYKAPSILQVPGADEIAVEFFSLSKSYNMPGWRVGFMCGNKTLVGALAQIKSYLDYGTFTPIQVAAIAALEGPQDCVDEIRNMYQCRRDVLCDGLNAIGWTVEKPKATMFVWAKIPQQYMELGSLEFSKKFDVNTVLGNFLKILE